LIHDGELLGNCISAAVMLGYDTDIAQGALRLVSFSEEYTPDPGKHRFYSELFTDYMDQFSRILKGS
ncbi:MAG: hypothetical protein ACLFST_07575, partial [Spirochaetia bacterium]